MQQIAGRKILFSNFLPQFISFSAKNKYSLCIFLVFFSLLHLIDTLTIHDIASFNRSALIHFSNVFGEELWSLHEADSNDERK